MHAKGTTTINAGNATAYLVPSRGSTLCILFLSFPFPIFFPILILSTYLPTLPIGYFHTSHLLGLWLGTYLDIPLLTC